MPTFRLHRRWWLPPLIVALLVVVYGVAGFVGVPSLVKTLARDQVGKLGRKLAIGQVQFNPLSLEFSVDQLKLSEADDQPLVAFDRLFVNFSLLDSIREGGM